MSSPPPNEVIEQLAQRYGIAGEDRQFLLQLLMQAPSRDAEQTVVPDAPEPPPEGLETVTTPLDETQETVVHATRQPPPAHPDRSTFGRYEDLGPLGRGAVGLVYRVRDPALKRTMALKVLRPDMLGRAEVEGRFVEEAQVSAQLQHPGLVPVHELGQLPDGRHYFTMKEVQGRTLMEVLQEVHAASDAQEWRPGPSGWNLRRILIAFRQVCDAVAYAHSCGVVHRDLKPQNVMVGDFGEVLVLDWGLAKLAHQAEPLSVSAAGHSQALDVTSSMETQYGDVRGTPAFMSPEQARGAVDQVGPASDVYGLGAVLYYALTGHRPHRGDTVKEIIAFVAEGQAPALSSSFPVPDALWDIVQRAMAPAPRDRFADASALAQALNAWLEGEQQREQALELVQYADALQPRIRSTQQATRRLRQRARALLDALPPTAPVDDKLPGWRLEDQAAQQEKQARLLELEFEQTLRSALNLVPDLHAAHERLAEWYREGLERAEALRDTRRSEVLQVLVSTHDVAGRHAAYLRGDGALTLHTDPPGAEVRIQRYGLQDRRLVLEESRLLGRTPLNAITLPMGSYLCELRAPGRRRVRYPVFIERGTHWDGVPPGHEHPEPVHLPPTGTLQEDDIYVPQGWFWSGGDPMALASLPSRKAWMDSFIIKRTPVTNLEFLRFLNALLAQGDEALAEQLRPHRYSPLLNAEGLPAFVRGHAGRFELADPGALRWPVCQVNWLAVQHYISWRRRQDALPWRLPGEFEQVKSARGADRRLFSWGDVFHEEWCNVNAGPHSRHQPREVTDFTVDVSPYGVLGVCSNVTEFCRDPFVVTPELAGPDGRVAQGDTHADDLEDEQALNATRVNRFGNWFNDPQYARICSRIAMPMGAGWEVIGFRMARSYRRSSS